MKLKDLKAGDTVIVDGGFTCMKPGHKEVLSDNGGLYLGCDEGVHYLVGQEDEDGELIGLSWP